MEFKLTQEQEMLRDAFKEFSEKEIAPLIEKAEEEHTFPIEILPKMGGLGYLGVPFPAEYGGSGYDDVSERKTNECLLMEEMSRVSAGISFGIQAAVVGAPNYIMRDYANEEQKQKYLVPAIKGEKIGAFSLTGCRVGCGKYSNNRYQRRGCLCIEWQQDILHQWQYRRFYHGSRIHGQGKRH